MDFSEVKRVMERLINSKEKTAWIFFKKVYQETNCRPDRLIIAILPE